MVGDSPHTGQFLSLRSLNCELHLERVVGDDASGERVPFAEDDLDGLGGLQRPDNPAEDAEHAGLLARRRQLGRRRFGVPAPVARADARLERRYLTVEPEDRAVHDRLLQEDRSVVHQKPRGEVVAAIDDDVVGREDAVDVRAGEALFIQMEAFRRGSSPDALAALATLGADAASRVEDLARGSTRRRRRRPMPSVPTPRAAR
jgi:hypothetical protein